MKQINANQLNTAQKLTAGVMLTVFLCICLFGATFTLHPAYASGMERAAAPCLNNGDAVFDKDNDPKIEPGMTLQKEFSIKNVIVDDTGNGKAVYYGFYFEKLNSYSGILEVTILDKNGNILVPTDTMANMHKGNIKKAEINGVKDVLEADEEKMLILRVHCPEEAGNETMNKTFEFNFGLAFSEDSVTTPQDNASTT